MKYYINMPERWSYTNITQESTQRREIMSEVTGLKVKQIIRLAKIQKRVRVSDAQIGGYLAECAIRCTRNSVADLAISRDPGSVVDVSEYSMDCSNFDQIELDV
jgi:hypothetical protein